MFNGAFIKPDDQGNTRQIKTYHLIRFSNFGAEWKTKFVYFDIVLKTDPFLLNFGDSLENEVGDGDGFDTEAKKEWK